MLEQLYWFAVQVKTNHESRSANGIAARGIETFAPCYEEEHKWSDRIKVIERPLFPGYVFVRCGFADRVTIIKVPSVQRVVGLGSIPVTVDEEEIAAVKAAVANGLRRRPQPDLKEGQRIVIKRGPLTGARGILVSSGAGPTFIVSITLLQRAVSIDVDPYWIEGEELPQSSLRLTRTPKPQESAFI